MHEILKKLRYDMFPEIDDWTDPQDHIKKADPKTLDFWHLVWFNPIFFVIVKLGIPFNFLIWGLVLSIKGAKYGLSWALYLPLIITIVCLIWFFREISKIDVYLESNMYDVLLKDYK